MSVFDPECTSNRVVAAEVAPFERYATGDPYDFTLSFEYEGQSFSMEHLSFTDMQRIKGEINRAMTMARREHREWLERQGEEQ